MRTGVRVKRRERLSTQSTRAVYAWGLWDWGSASFNSVVTTFVFSVYLTSDAFRSPGIDPSARLGVWVAGAGILIALTAPVLGQQADRRHDQRPRLAFFTVLVVLIMAAMLAVRPEPSYLDLGLFLLAAGNVCFELASVHYNAMLAELVPPSRIGWASGLGWGLGYLGGIVLMGLLLIGFIAPDVGWFGVTGSDAMNIRVSIFVSALWFVVFALPVFFLKSNRPLEAGERGVKRRGILAPYRDLWSTLVRLRRTEPRTLWFLLASALFRDGLAGVFTFGAVLAQGSFGFSADTVVIFAIGANLIAGLATIAGGYLDDGVGPRRVIVVSLACMIAIGTVLFFAHGAGAWAFWVFGLALCAFVGPVQSASRSMLARITGRGLQGEMFGLYATSGRAVSFITPALFALFVSMGHAQYFGIIGLIVPLGAGLAMMTLVRE